LTESTLDAARPRESRFTKAWWAFEFWRFAFVHDEVGKYALELLPVQKARALIFTLKEGLGKKMAAQTAD